MDSNVDDELQEVATPKELRAIEKGMWRSFAGACTLCALIVVFATYMLWRAGSVPVPILVGFPSIMLWSLVVTVHSFHSVHRFARSTKEALVRRTCIDETTGVFNLSYLNSRLREEAERTQRHGGHTAVLYLDLDHFKQVNDSYGHFVGNIVLEETAMVLRRQLRGCDIFGRVGGDEFVALLPQTGLEEARPIAERLRQALEQHAVDLGDSPPIDFVRTSIGIAIYPDDGDSMQGVVKAADHAVYDAKKVGGNKVAVSAESVNSE